MGETIQVKRIVLTDSTYHEEGTAVLYDNYLAFNFHSEGKMDLILPWHRVAFIELY